MAGFGENSYFPGSSSNKHMKSLFFSLALLLALGASAQEKAPLVKGKVKISIKEGTFDCDLTLAEYPHLKDYFIRLNAGMNLMHIRSKKPNDFVIYYSKSQNDTASTGESRAYFFKDNTGKGKFLPEELQFRYVGKFPVATDTINNFTRTDWKGNIAFNYNSVRSDGYQASWYPVLYDITTDKVFDEVRYDIEMECIDCSTLYVSGSLPVKAQKTRFKSEVPREMTIFCGNYDFKNVGDTYILNPDLTDAQLSEFTHLTNSYKKFLADKLQIPYDQPVTFVQTTPTSKKDGWLFVSYPTIFSIGWGENGLQSLFNPKIQNWYRPFIAHELGHAYFGTYRVFNSELGDMMSEGFAEFLSLKVTQQIIGKEVYDKKIADKIKDLKGFKPTPFSKVKARADYSDREYYVYYYAPLVLLAVEKEIGEKKMYDWMRNLLQAKTTFTNYDFFLSTLKSAVKDDKKFGQIVSKYFEGDKTLETAVVELGFGEKFNN